MYYQKDYLMRQIEDMVRFIAKVLFGKDLFKYEIADQANLTQTDLLYANLMTLVSQRKICEAEDLLFDSIEKGNTVHARIALDFYETINALSDDELESSNFSREEIKDGLKQITAILGVDMDGIF
jgi:hypothetical protein